MKDQRPIAQSIQRLQRRLIELSAWRDRYTLPLVGRFKAAGAEEWVPLQEGQAWPSRDFPVQMEFSATVPPGWAGEPVWVRLGVGGEAWLSVGGRVVGGLNPYHREYPVLDQARGGEELRFVLEAVPKGLFGTPIYQPRIEEARLVVPDLLLRAFHEDLAAALDAAGYLVGGGKPEIAALLGGVIEEALAGLALPRSPTPGYLARLVQAPEAAAVQASIWDEWHFEAEPVALPEAVRAELPARREAFRAALEHIRTRYPAEGRLWLSGHAHIDLAWLWPFAETRRKVRRTFATVAHLMERYPELYFNQSSAQAYAWLEEDDPELFERVRERVQEGRWELVGGMWVEPDGNLLAGESWVRQLLYGQRYFESRFGRMAKVCWLPDTFGYTANLPQLLQLAGIPYFFTTKLNWNETNAFPYDLYYWEGLDGSRVLAHSFNNDAPAPPGFGGYNGRVMADDLGRTWRNFKSKRFADTSLFSFGAGDGGGGPTAEMLERYRRLKDFPGLPQLETGRVEDFYDAVAGQNPSLPVWVGEQYLELHRGTYTTQGRVKGLHRRLEHTLVEAEAAAALAYRMLGRTYPQAELYSAWTTLLRHQFHDVLPGSSVHQVYQEAWRDLAATLEQAERMRGEALRELSAAITPEPRDAQAQVVVWNLTLEDRPLRLCLPRPSEGGFRLLAPGGVEVPYQELGGEVFAEAEGVCVPGLGYLALAVVPGTPRPAPGGLEVSPNVLENHYLRVEVAPDGTLASLYDKQAGREVLGGRGNQLWAYPDLPREWEAWEVDAAYAQDGVEVLAAEAPRVLEPGPLRASLRVERRLEGAVIVQDYRLTAGGRRLEVVTHIRWERRRTLLRAYFPLAVRSHEAWYETAFGAVARPTHTNTPWDAARFEVPALRWADLSEAGYGVSLLNDGKYGHSARGSTLGLTLLRAPVYPDPYADEGEHRFTYALYPHAGDWRSGTLREAHDLGAPLQAVIVFAQGSGWPVQQHFARIQGAGLRLAALKKSEEGQGLILRLYEAHGGRGEARLEGPLVRGAKPVDLLEQATGLLEPMGPTLRFGFRPYQVISLEI
ncbi:MAG: alpha-mannosidase [Deinococcota bacterium]